MMEYNFLKIQEKLLSKIIKIKFFNRKNIKWENVKWECQMGMSNEKCQIGRMSNGIFPIFKLIKLIFYC